MGVAAIVLAAGLSTRMGTNKLLQQIDGEALIHRVVRNVQGSRAEPVLVILGHQGIEVDRALPHTRPCTVFDGSTRDGMSASIRAGVRTLERSFADCSGTFFVLGDMPWISPGLLDKMIDAFEAGEANTIWIPSRRGARGNPVLFGRSYFPDLLALEGDVGARSIVAANEEHVREVEADDDGVLTDIDTPEELEAFRLRIS